MKKIFLCLSVLLSLSLLCEAKTKIYLIGDATLASHSVASLDSYGWGGAFAQCVTSKVDVENHAKAGESTHTLVDKRLAKILASSNPDDIVLLQIGQNDMRMDRSNMYYSTEEMVEKLIKILDFLSKKELKVVLATPLAQPFYRQGELVDRMGSYPESIRRVAKAKNIPLLDLHRATYQWLKEIGEDEAKKYFTHISDSPARIEYNLTEAGSQEVCKIALKELKKSKIRIFNRYLIDSAIP